ncbi:MAG: ThuA domain-containing protein [Myxococcaceae bacterium]|nr:ThuA domain-containing protein [Myxococcaceae bacterium]MCI0672683.1 ThuA domain-containing protein [Myxococcaceae bacterium]
MAPIDPIVRWSARLAAVLLAVLTLSGCAPSLQPVRVEGEGPLRLVVFTRTTGFRHDSLPAARDALVEMARAQGWSLQSTEDSAAFVEALAGSDVAVFLLTTGDVLDEAQQDALEAFVRRGGGFVGVHSASDTEYDWPFYGELVGAYFRSHPLVQRARVHVESADHPATRHLPDPWERTDEWYDFRTNPRPQVNVLLTLDESSYSGGGMGEDHPVAWTREVDAGRSFYTALGHTTESYSEAEFLLHLRGGVEWVGRLVQ